jgi:hypothetical protein
MALALNDRVQQTGTANTTVSFTLTGSVVGFQTFAVIGNGNTTYYAATDASGSWEVGIGTYSTTGPTLTRTTILASSNSGSAVTFSGGVNVFVTYPSEKSVNQDANGNVNILTYVPNTNTYIGTLNVGDGTYSLLQSGQIATFAAADTVVNGISVQNTSTSNTAYSALQVGANNYNNGYYLMLGTNSSTYDYAAAGYANNAANQPDANYIEANKSDLSIITWDSNDIHFIQNASAATTDSMTLFASGGVSLGGYGDPGLGTLYANNVYLGFTTITAAAGTTILTNASAAWQNVVGTTTQTIQMPDATTLFKGFAFTITNSSTGAVTITDDATATLDTLVTGGSAIMVLIDNATIAGTWKAYSYLPSSYDFNATSASFANATITNAVWNGTTIASGYGGTGLTTFAAANNALYSTSASALVAGTLPIAAGGTAATTFTANGVIYGNGTSPLGVTAAGTTGQVLIGNTGAAPSWGTVSSSLVSSFQTSLSGLTPSTATTGAVTLAGTLGVSSGGTGQTTYTDGQLLIGNSTGNTLTKASLTAGTGISITPGSGSISIASTVTSGITIVNDTTSATPRFVMFDDSNTGTVTTVNVSSTQLTFLPSTGLLSAPELAASNGIVLNSKTVNTSYSIPAGYNATATGPITIASGAAVTLPTGSRWVIL